MLDGTRAAALETLVVLAALVSLVVLHAIPTAVVESGFKWSVSSFLAGTSVLTPDASLGVATADSCVSIDMAQLVDEVVLFWLMLVGRSACTLVAGAVLRNVEGSSKVERSARKSNSPYGLSSSCA